MAHNINTAKETKEYKHISRWTMPQYYIGELWPDYYSAGIGKSRDSDALERANFDAMLSRLGGESETVIVVRESHWAVGWVEWIAIHATDTKALEIADSIKGKLEDYSIIDEDLFSRYEYEECETVWSQCYDDRERADYLRRHVHKVYALSGETTYTMLRAAVKGSWYHAANLLPCPSDLLS
jgi:hypothetical protein